MILIGLGSNLNGPWGTPQEAVQQAMQELNAGQITLLKASELKVTEPFGRKNQPPFVNAAALITTHLSPDALLRRLHMIEHRAGRQRRLRWGPHTLDLDLLDYHGLKRPRRGQSIKPLILPHPGILERIFVLQPLAEIAPRWKHPITHETAIFTIQKRYTLKPI